ncbi:MAG: hypothetical protein LDL37_14180 [Asticcacaulis sp.]|uniref:hypothetical protein n=1 Tax=Asticcacaulis sp. TaxID=1872648 RepID=UPI0025C603EF|nr:hypothetical protein [Asticcacaulis sp.]MCA1936594.1 hypothetical protein [Asticcacaulis sp.]
MKFDSYWPLIKSLYASVAGAAAGAGAFLLLVYLESLFVSATSIEEGVEFLINPGFIGLFAIVFGAILVPFVALGLPVQAILQRYHQTGYSLHVVFSAAAGGIMSLFIVYNLELQLVCAAAGFVAGSVAWFIRRPDRDVAKALP